MDGCGDRIFDVVVNTDSEALTPILHNFVKELDGEVIRTFPPDLNPTNSSLRILRSLRAILHYVFPKVSSNYSPVQSIVHRSHSWMLD